MSQNPSLFEYDEAIGEKLSGWRAFPRSGRAIDAVLRVAHGYAAFVRNQHATILDFTGPVNQGELNVPLSYSLHVGRPNGWHLIGNPYPSAISWESSALTKNALSHVIAVTDNDERRFRYWDGDPQYSGLVDGRIALAQSFWVRTISTGASLTFREAAKSVDAAFYRRPMRSTPGLCISVSSGKLYDQAILRLRRQSADTLDMWDGPKLLNDSLNISTIAADGTSLAIDSRPSLPDSIALSLSEAGEGRYHLKISAHDSLRNLRYAVGDKYLKRKFTINRFDSLEFVITADNESARPDRFTVFLLDSALNFTSGLQASPDTSFVSHNATLFSLHRGVHGTTMSTHALHQTIDSLCIEVYPNPAVSELIVEYCCDFVRLNAWKGIWEAGKQPATEHAFHPVIYNAMGMRVDPSTFSIASMRLSPNSTNPFQGCSRYVISVGKLAPGNYQIWLPNGRLSQWIRFVKL